MMPGLEVDTAEDMVMVEDTVMAEGMDSTEAMALMGIMGIAEGMVSTGIIGIMDSTMVSLGIMDSAAILISAPHLSPGLIADTTHTTRRPPYTPSPSTGTTAPIPKAIIHTSRTAGVRGCQLSRRAPLHSQQGIVCCDLGCGRFSPAGCSQAV